ncbi:50S ribosomal protein L16 [Patescibacteria group bacterium]|nr:50S ribosomal protein L16 [Patescibacteria group bacterium]
MLQPKKSKFRKQFRGKMRGNSKGAMINFGEYGLKATNRSWLTPNQIEAARKAITNYTKRKARVWIRIFPDKPITQKGAGAPLGAGKGDVCGHVAVVKPGRIIFEISGVPEDISLEALKRASFKLPVMTKIVRKK